MKINFAVIPETKKETQGSKFVDEFIMIYSEVRQEHELAKHSINRPTSWEENIQNFEFIKDRIITVRRLASGNATVIAIYATEEAKRYVSKTFYKQLYFPINKCYETDHVILMGDFNDCIGNISIPRNRRLRLEYLNKDQPYNQISSRAD